MTRLAYRISLYGDQMGLCTIGLIKYGAKLTHVNPSVRIPDCVYDIADRMERCRKICVLLMGFRKRCAMHPNLMRAVVDQVWDTRVDDVWKVKNTQF